MVDTDIATNIIENDISRINRQISMTRNRPGMTQQEKEVVINRLNQQKEDLYRQMQTKEFTADTLERATEKAKNKSRNAREDNDNKSEAPVGSLTAKGREFRQQIEAERYRTGRQEVRPPTQYSILPGSTTYGPSNITRPSQREPEVLTNIPSGTNQVVQDNDQEQQYIKQQARPPQQTVKQTEGLNIFQGGSPEIISGIIPTENKNVSFEGTVSEFNIKKEIPFGFRTSYLLGKKSREFSMEAERRESQGQSGFGLQVGAFGLSTLSTITAAPGSLLYIDKTIKSTVDAVFNPKQSGKIIGEQIRTEPVQFGGTVVGSVIVSAAATKLVNVASEPIVKPRTRITSAKLTSSIQTFEDVGSRSIRGKQTAVLKTETQSTIGKIFDVKPKLKEEIIKIDIKGLRSDEGALITTKGGVVGRDIKVEQVLGIKRTGAKRAVSVGEDVITVPKINKDLQYRSRSIQNILTKNENTQRQFGLSTEPDVFKVKKGTVSFTPEQGVGAGKMFNIPSKVGVTAGKSKKVLEVSKPSGLVLTSEGQRLEGGQVKFYSGKQVISDKNTFNKYFKTSGGFRSEGKTGIKVLTGKKGQLSLSSNIGTGTLKEGISKTYFKKGLSSGEIESAIRPNFRLIEKGLNTVGYKKSRFGLGFVPGVAFGTSVFSSQLKMPKSKEVVFSEVRQAQSPIIKQAQQPEVITSPVSKLRLIPTTALRTTPVSELRTIPITPATSVFSMPTLPPIIPIPFSLPKINTGRSRGKSSGFDKPVSKFLPSIGVITGIFKGIKPTKRRLTGFEQRGRYTKRISKTKRKTKPVFNLRKALRKL